MKTYFLIVNHNDFDSTKHLVLNIIDYDIIDKILIVDNGSTVKEKELLNSLLSNKVEILFREENLGYSEAINYGARYLIEHCGECKLFISNSDIIVMSENDLIKMLTVLDEERVGIVGPQILELGRINRGMKCPSVWMDIAHNLPIIKYVVQDKKLHYDESHYKTLTSEVEVLNTCFFLIKSNVLKEIHFMDSEIFLYYEEYILAKKIEQLGLKAILCNTVKIKHLYAKSIDRVSKEYEKFKIIKKSQYYYHTTYNHLNKAIKTLLKISIIISAINMKIVSFFSRH